jgi:hypothetical protein
MAILNNSYLCFKDFFAAAAAKKSLKISYRGRRLRYTK